ncbi:hypothetical protein BpHYR1_020980 [Brachionus plicatilis]|uniref:Uncharacterized protein n=1 Tax=Brachionus plicatilis TaxID=10195 RepID=A0A3M7P4P2_BRAPC|nr:hypothetical protein BpHYR1_020980 [Brachionus plicatilis]
MDKNCIEVPVNIQRFFCVIWSVGKIEMILCAFILVVCEWKVFVAILYFCCSLYSFNSKMLPIASHKTQDT